MQNVEPNTKLTKKKLTLNEIAAELRDPHNTPKSKIIFVEQIKNIILEHAFRGIISESFIDEVLKTVDALFECDGDNTRDMLTARVKMLAVYMYLGEYDAILKKVDEILREKMLQADSIRTANDRKMFVICLRYQMYLFVAFRRYEEVAKSWYKVCSVVGPDYTLEYDDVIMETQSDQTHNVLEDLCIKAMKEQELAVTEEEKKKLSDCLSSFQKSMQEEKKREENCCVGHLLDSLLKGFPENDMTIDLNDKLSFNSTMLQFLAGEDRWEDVIHLCQYMIAYYNNKLYTVDEWELSRAIDNKLDTGDEWELSRAIDNMVDFYQELGYAYFRTNRWTLAKKTHQAKEAFIRKIHVFVSQDSCQDFLPAWWYRSIMRNDHQNKFQKTDQAERVHFVVESKQENAYEPDLFSITFLGKETQLNVLKLLMYAERAGRDIPFSPQTTEESNQVWFADSYQDPFAPERALLKPAMRLAGFVLLGPGHSTYLTLFEALSQASKIEGAKHVINDRILKATHVVNLIFPAMPAKAITRCLSYYLQPQMIGCLKSWCSFPSAHLNPLCQVDPSHERWQIFQAYIENFYPGEGCLGKYDFTDALTTSTHIHVKEVLEFYETHRKTLMDVPKQPATLPQVKKSKHNFFVWALQGEGGTVRDNPLLSYLTTMSSMDDAVDPFLKKLLTETFHLEEEIYSKVSTAIWGILSQSSILTGSDRKSVNPIFRLDLNTSLTQPLCMGMLYALRRLFQECQPQEYAVYMAYLKINEETEWEWEREEEEEVSLRDGPGNRKEKKEVTNAGVAQLPQTFFQNDGNEGQPRQQVDQKILLLRRNI